MRRLGATSSIGLLLLLLFAGCAEDGGPGAETETEATNDAVFAPEAPGLLEPVADQIEIPVTRVADLEFVVEAVVSGLTSVVIDGVSLGPMQSGSIDGTLDAERLRLRLGGAMYTTNHSLSLQTPTAAETLTSREVTLVLTPSASPTVVAELGPPIRLEAATIFATGRDRFAMLTALRIDPAGAVATVFPMIGAAAWDQRFPIEFDLPNWTPDEELASTLAVARTPRSAGGKGDRLRAVWRVGPAGDGLRFVDASLDAPVFSSATLVELDSQLLGAAEFGRIGRPLILGDTIVAELLLAGDVEQPRPGDRTLLTVHLEGSPARPRAPRVSTIAVGADIDRLSPALDLQAPLGAEAVFAARLADIAPVVFEVNGASGVIRQRATLANDRFPLFAEAATAPVTILGAFSSRTLFAPIGGSTPRALVLQFSDRAPDGRQDASPSADAVADLGDPTAAPVGTVLAGSAVFILPMGPDAEVAVFVSAGPRAEVARIADLRCDEVAVSYSSAGNAEGHAALACRVGTAVQLGELRIDPA